MIYVYIYIYIYIYATSSCEISRSIIDDLVDICDEIIGTKKKTIPTKTVNMNSISTYFYILPAYLLIAIALIALTW